jgi:ribonuclease P protein component
MFPYTSSSGRRAAGLRYDSTGLERWPKASAPTNPTRDGAPRRTGSASGCARAPGGRSSPLAGGKAAAASPFPADVRGSNIERVFQEGRPAHGERVVLFAAPGSGGIALVAGKKVGGAVQRNRARRILRAALHEIAPDGIEGRDVVVVARQTIRGARTQDLVAEMTELLAREAHP